MIPDYALSVNFEQRVRRKPVSHRGYRLPVGVTAIRLMLQAIAVIAQWLAARSGSAPGTLRDDTITHCEYNFHQCCVR